MINFMVTKVSLAALVISEIRVAISGPWLVKGHIQAEVALLGQNQSKRIS